MLTYAFTVLILFCFNCHVAVAVDNIQHCDLVNLYGV